MGLIISSESFKEGEFLATPHVLSEAYGFGCKGDNLSPQLSWSNVPEGTRSFALKQSQYFASFSDSTAQFSVKQTQNPSDTEGSVFSSGHHAHRPYLTN